MFKGRCIKRCVLDTTNKECWVRHFHVGVRKKQKSKKNFLGHREVLLTC